MTDSPIPPLPAPDDAPNAAPETPAAPPSPAPAPDAPLDLSSLSDFSFEPDWAADASAHTTFSTRGDERPDRGDRSHSRFGDRDSRRESRPRSFDRNPRGPRPPRDPRDFRRDGDSRPPRFSRDDRGPRPDRPPRADRPDRSPRDPNAPRPPFRRDGRPGDRRNGPRGPRAPRMNVDIAFLPDRERLMLVVRDIQASRRAFPLMDIAARFLEREDSHILRLELPKPKTPDETRKTFFQCRECKRVFTTRANAEAHVLSAHLDLFFVPGDVEVPPPAGTFTSVARCGYSGELLGPPNFHGYNERINELWSTRFSHIPKADYLARIETLHDEAALEEWKKSVSHKTMYRQKLTPPPPAPETPATVEAPAESATPEPPAEAPAAAVAPEAEAPQEAASAPAVQEPATATENATSPEPAAPPAPLLGDPIEKSAAQDWVRVHELSRLIRESPRCMVPGTQARRWDDPSLRAAVDSARYREGQFAFTLSLALRPAFRHMRLHLFKINARETYVTAIQPAAFDEANATPLDREIVDFLRAATTSYTRKTLLEALRPGVAPDTPEAADVLRHLVDLIAHGVIAELHTGTLFIPHLHAPETPAPEAAAAEAPASSGAAPEPPAAQEPPASSEAPAAEAPAPEAPVVPEVPSPEPPAPEPAAEPPAPEPEEPPAPAPEEPPAPAPEEPPAPPAAAPASEPPAEPSPTP